MQTARELQKKTYYIGAQGLTKKFARVPAYNKMVIRIFFDALPSLRCLGINLEDCAVRAFEWSYIYTRHE